MQILGSGLYGPTSEQPAGVSHLTQLDYPSTIDLQSPHQLLPIRLSAEIGVSLNNEFGDVTPAIYFPVVTS
jgi:hypothetical protein